MEQDQENSVGKRTRRRQACYALVKRFEASEQSVAAFCEAQGINESSFYYWRKRYRRSAASSGPFIEVDMRKSFTGLYALVKHTMRCLASTILSGRRQLE